MENVYITKYSFSQISSKLKTKINLNREELIDYIVNDFEELDITKEKIADLINTNELEEFYLFKNILINFEKFLNEIENNKKNIQDHVKSQNNSLLFNISEPAYHLNSSCKWMSKSFYNVKLPDNLHIEEKLKIEIKDWILKNKSNYNFQDLNHLFKQKFNFSFDLIEQRIDNSGTQSFENKEIDYIFDEEIKEKFKQLKFFFDQDFAQEILNYKYADSWKILKNKEFYSQNVIDLHTVKDAFKNIIQDYYIKKYNKELKFNSSTLERIGFKKCKACEKELTPLVYNPVEIELDF